MKVELFDTTKLNAGDKVPIVTEWDRNTLWYGYGAIMMVNENGYLVKTESDCGFIVLMSYSHEGKLLRIEPINEGGVTMQWWVLEPTKENFNKVERYYALREIRKINFADLPDAIIFGIAGKLKPYFVK